MPEYDYVCEGCQHTFSRISNMSAYKEPTEAPCSECGRRRVRIAITSSSPLIDSVRLFGMKADGSWRETLAKIHESTPGSRLKDTSSVQF